MNPINKLQPITTAPPQRAGVRTQRALLGIYIALAGVWLGLGLVHPAWWPPVLGLAWSLIAVVQAVALFVPWWRQRRYPRLEANLAPVDSGAASLAWSPSIRWFLVGVLSMFLAVVFPLIITTAAMVLLTPEGQAQQSPAIESWATAGVAIFAVLAFTSVLSWIISAGFYLTERARRSEDHRVL